MISPIKIAGKKVYVKPVYSATLKSLSEEYLPFRYPHPKNIFWKNGEGNSHKKKEGTVKSVHASKIVDLRIQFQPVCCRGDFNLTRNDVVRMEENSFSARDFIYQWHFVHRHGFPSSVRGSGRGQSMKVADIVNHPLSYMLMCEKHHEEYDRENGEWKNPKNREKYQSDS